VLGDLWDILHRVLLLCRRDEVAEGQNECVQLPARQRPALPHQQPARPRPVREQREERQDPQLGRVQREQELGLEMGVMRGNGSGWAGARPLSVTLLRVECNVFETILLDKYIDIFMYMYICILVMD
jgi:hypothetical protein